MTPALSAVRDLACDALLTSAAAGLLLCALAEAAARSGVLRTARARAAAWTAVLALTAAAAPLAALADRSEPQAVRAGPSTSSASSTSADGRRGGGLQLPSRVLDVLALVWLAGAVAGAARVAAGMRRARRLKRAATPLEDTALTAVLAEAGALGRQVEVRASGDVSTAALVGYRRPAVILPAETKLTHDELRWILLHECAHARRWDDVALAIETLLRALLWPNPAVHWAATRIAFERELACDEWAMARSAAPPRAYARTLVRAAALAIGAPPAAIAPGFGRRAGLARRVDALLRGAAAARSRPAARVACGGLAAGVGVALVLLAASPPRIRGAASPEREPPIASAAADCVIPLGSLPDPGPRGVVAIDPSAARPMPSGALCDPSTVRATVIPTTQVAHAVE
jgi:beta-lactamase regulating signal transducer with metallopeptidase domain